MALYSGLKLLQNPVNGDYIELALYLKQHDSVNLTLYNSLGQEVKLYSLPQLSSGHHRLRIPTTNLPSGVYFIRYIASSFASNGTSDRSLEFSTMRQFILVR